MSKKNYQSVKMLGLNLFSGQRVDLLSALFSQVDLGVSPLVVVTPNPEQVVQMYSSADFKSAVTKADLLLPDGVGLTLAAKILLRSPKKLIRHQGREVTKSLVEYCLEKNLSVLVIGGRDYAGRQFLSYKVHGVNDLVDRGGLFWTPGYENATSPTQKEEADLKNVISVLKPAVILVALGAPTQELWLAHHDDWLDKNQVKIGMAVGGSFDALLGLVPSAPDWMAQIGLEWLFRLVTQPWRWKRQTRLVSFIGLVLKEKFTLKRD